MAGVVDADTHIAESEAMWSHVMCVTQDPEEKSLTSLSAWHSDTIK